ncbi:MAG: ABC transporter substrate binding protein, partial [Ruthenibacterium sp.]
MALTIDFQNANNDLSTIDTICRQFVADKVDVIIAIATPAAQGAATAVEGTEIPVVFSAVTDPVAAELVDSFDAPGGN